MNPSATLADIAMAALILLLGNSEASDKAVHLICVGINQLDEVVSQIRNKSTILFYFFQLFLKISFYSTTFFLMTNEPIHWHCVFK